MPYGCREAVQLCTGLWLCSELTKEPCHPTQGNKPSLLSLVHEIVQRLSRKWPGTVRPLIPVHLWSTSKWPCEVAMVKPETTQLYRCHWGHQPWREVMGNHHRPSMASLSSHSHIGLFFPSSDKQSLPVSLPLPCCFLMAAASQLLALVT